ncbi:MAG: helix-turn-helix transcriptional regulator [Eubacterium sp.]|nr:helix-turn-helix transcriptional regulator [Eubacterium sp.]MCC8174528.1 helix-turn-helix transcriptional regulator [Odoribacter sp.]
MGKNRSFKEYIANRFNDEFWRIAEEYINDNTREFDKDFKKIHRLGNIEITDVKVEQVKVEDLPGTKVQFDVSVSIWVEIQDGDYHYDETEESIKWIKLQCKGDLGNNLDDFEICSVQSYNGKSNIENSTDDSLVPYIKKDMMDKVANDFLERYYPEALKIPTDNELPIKVDPMKLAENMGLNVLVHRIKKDSSIFGQIYFEKQETEMYDEDSDTYIPMVINEKTIVVDPENYFLRNLGSVNNTIVHECVHWDKHYKAFLLERLYNRSASNISCEIVGGAETGISEKTTEFMEFQANQLAPRIQMPAGPFKVKANQYIVRFMRETSASHPIEVMETVIRALERDFGVSRQAAKIRLVELGFEDAVGTFNYIDGHYVKPYSFRKNVLKDNQTYSISVIDAAIQSITNPELYKNIRDGSYVYVDSHFVLNHPLFLYEDEYNHVQLTEYARHHMDQCCLVFNLSISGKVKKAYHSECYLNRDENSSINFEIAFSGEFDDTQKKKYLNDMLTETGRVLESLPNNFPGAMKACMEWRGFTQRKLASETGISERTIGRILNGENQPTLVNVVLICFGLKLPPQISRFLLQKSSHNITYSKQDEALYDFALTYLYTKPISEIREFLYENGGLAI